MHSKTWGMHSGCSCSILQHLLKLTLFFSFLQIKKKIPVPDDITEQGVPAGHVPLIPDISELLRELPNLEPICK